MVGLWLMWIAAAADGHDRLGILPQILPYLREDAEVIEVLYFAWVRERIGLPRERVETRPRPWPIWWPNWRRARRPLCAGLLPTRRLRVALDQELAGF
jgi:molybdopterin synthase sulfur carrier subunit